MTVSRRDFLLAGLVSAGLPGLLTACSKTSASPPSDTTAATLPAATASDAVRLTPAKVGPTVVSGQFVSKARKGTTVGWSVAYPYVDASERLPVALYLHGLGDDHTSPFVKGKLHTFLADRVRGGSDPFVIASIDGGGTYWHPHASGDDPVRMLIDEYLPMLGARGLDTSKLAVMGISMGGYGALLLPTEPGTPKFAAVVASSPGLRHNFADMPAGTFDNVAEFDEYDLFARTDKLAEVPTWIDSGTSDDFIAAQRELVAKINPRPTVYFEPGAHNWDHWVRMAPRQLDFLGEHLR